MYLYACYITIVSFSVCSDIGTLMSSDRNYQDDLDTNMSTVDVEGEIFMFIFLMYQDPS